MWTPPGGGDGLRQREDVSLCPRQQTRRNVLKSHRVEKRGYFIHSVIVEIRAIQPSQPRSQAAKQATVCRDKKVCMRLLLLGHSKHRCNKLELAPAADGAVLSRPMLTFQGSPPDRAAPCPDGALGLHGQRCSAIVLASLQPRVTSQPLAEQRALQRGPASSLE